MSLLKPLIKGWLIFSLTFFVFLCFAHYRRNRIVRSEALKAKDPAEKNNLDIGIDSVDKASIPTLVVLLSGVAVVLMLLMPIIFLSKEAQKIASTQINKYTENGMCIDAFDNTHLGCYQIPGEEGTDKLIIHNNEKVLIYMSRVDKSDTDESEEEHDFYVHITNKVNGEKISRYFVKR